MESVGDVLAAEGDLAVRHLFQAGQAVDELGLAVALDAGQADDLAGPHLEGDVLDGVFSCGVELGTVTCCTSRITLPGLAGAFSTCSWTSRPTIMRESSSWVVLAMSTTPTYLPLRRTVQRSATAMISFSFVGDKEDALAFLFEPAHDLHQLVDLLRGQNGGGLVKDQDLVVAVEHLEDLHALLHTHRDVADQSVGVYPQAVLFAQSHDLFAGLGLLQKAQLVGLHPQDDVVQNREALHQFEVLVHHADAQGVGIVGVADLHLLAVFADGALFGLVQAEQTLIRVLLPAPFSPSRACTSPLRSWRVISSFALIPGIPWVIWSISIT